MTDLTEALTAEIARTPYRNWYADRKIEDDAYRVYLKAASGDPVAMQASLEDLKGYGND